MKKKNKETKAFETSAISQPSRRQVKTGVALPDDERVEQAREWINDNQK